MRRVLGLRRQGRAAKICWHSILCGVGAGENVFSYLVTAKHVIVMIKQLSVDGQVSFATGAAGVDLWRSYPDDTSVDVAALAWLPGAEFEFKLIAFNGATAQFGDREYRMNGQHSSAMLSELNSSFPKDLKVHLDTYKVAGDLGLNNPTGSISPVLGSSTSGVSGSAGLVSPSSPGP